ncbi:MAG: DUF4139 domain-containing protein, partial [Phycisphaeraceae bacterium]|nr:DUF4139 domain-containing protein [Phycisphaeraceae bacterium]
MTAMRGMIVSLIVVTAHGATAGAEVMPLRRAVLYSSGVGYFEHQGDVSGSAAIELPFRTGQINDVLKSLVVLDPSGKAGSVNYGSADPLDKALSSFSIDVRSGSLNELLARARGAAVEVEGPQAAKGTILGVETRTEKHDDTEVTRHFLNLLTDKGLEAIEIESIHAVRFTDPKLQDELRKALSLVAEARDADARPVEVRLEGDGQRDVRIGYLVESPVWKTSYRLDLSGDKPLLQGWAIVENTSDADWNGIELSLVSGRPISFVQDLFTPLYLQRPLVKPENYAFLQPRLYDEGIAAGMPTAPPSPMVMRKARSLEARVGQQLAADKFSAGATMEMDAAPSTVGLDATMQAAAAADRVGEYFQFTIKEPVSIPRRRSAMLAILNQPVEAERISIYNASVLPKHPLAGAKLVNSTGLSLPAGPVTVFDGGAYAGDARIDDTTMGQERLLSFAVDTDVTVDPSVKTTQRVVAAKIVRGVLNLVRATEIRQTYAVLNKADRDK